MVNTMDNGQCHWIVRPKSRTSASLLLYLFLSEDFIMTANNPSHFVPPAHSLPFLLPPFPPPIRSFPSIQSLISPIPSFPSNSVRPYLPLSPSFPFLPSLPFPPIPSHSFPPSLPLYKHQSMCWLTWACVRRVKWLILCSVVPSRQALVHAPCLRIAVRLVELAHLCVVEAICNLFGKTELCRCAIALGSLNENKSKINISICVCRKFVVGRCSS